MTRYLFGINPEFELRAHERRLLADGQAVPLGSRALELLLVLLQRAGQVVGRRELMDRVWPDAAVDDNNLNVQIGTLRRLLGAGAIATVAGRGYCFTRLPRVGLDPVAGSSTPRLKTNLPASLPTLIGRDAELAELQQLVQAHPLVTVLGAGGMGKTLLAQHLLRRLETRYRHGVCFVELSSLSDPAGLPEAMAATLQIHPAGETALNGLVHAVASLEMLVVLDNAEHLVDGAAPMVQALLQAAPGLRLLVTSQAPLQLATERLFRLGPLACPSEPLPAEAALRQGAVALLVDRAQAADARFVLTDANAAAAIELCRALDGLPLAIELAAWRAPVLGVRRLADALQDPLKLLPAPRVGTPDRLQTLRGALAWSHGLLSREQQVLLRRLAVLRGGSDLDLVQAVAGDRPGEGALDDTTLQEALLTLVDRSLVSVVPDAGHGLRYRLLEAPRAFAHEQLQQAGELALMGQRHAQAMAARFAQAYQAHFSGHETRDGWAQRCLPDTDNGHAALNWLRRHDESSLLLSLLPGLMLATPREERQRLQEMATLSLDLALGAADPSPAVLWTLLEVSRLLMVRDIHRAHAPALQAVVQARRCASLLADQRWLFRALCQLAVTHLSLGQTLQGEACVAEARVIENPEWPAVLRRHRWIAEVWLADRQGDGEAMYRANLRLRSLSPESGAWNLSSGLNMINGALAAGRADEAVRCGLEVVAQLEGTRHLAGLVETRMQLVGALVACDRLVEARQHSRACWPLVVRLSRTDVWADYQALLAALEGRLADAAQLMGYANRLTRRQRTVRAHNEAAAARRTLHILQARCEPAQLQAWLALGEALDEPGVEAVAFAAAEPAS